MSRTKKAAELPTTNDNAKQLSKEHEISLRLANIEAMLAELLERRKASERTGADRMRSVHERLYRESLAKSDQPSERHFEAARRLLKQG